MAGITYSVTAGLNTSGITAPAAGDPAVTETISNSLSLTGLAATDCVENTHTVGPGTAATALDLGSITTGKALWLQAKSDIIVTLEQDLGAGAVENKVKGTFFMLIGDYTNVKVENAGASAIEIAVTRVGTRPAVSGGAGVE